MEASPMAKILKTNSGGASSDKPPEIADISLNAMRTMVQNISVQILDIPKGSPRDLASKIVCLNLDENSLLGFLLLLMGMEEAWVEESAWVINDIANRRGLDCGSRLVRIYMMVVRSFTNARLIHRIRPELRSQWYCEPELYFAVLCEIERRLGCCQSILAVFGKS